MNHVAEHTFKKNGWLGAEKHHGSSQFSFIAFETELQCHGVVYLSTKTPWFLVGFATFWMAFRHLYDSFFPHEMKQRGLTAWLASLSGSALSLSLFLSFFVDVLHCLLRYQKFYKNTQPKFRRNAHTNQSSLLFSCLEQSLHHCWSPFFLNKGVIFFQHPRAVIKTLLWIFPTTHWNGDNTNVITLLLLPSLLFSF